MSQNPARTLYIGSYAAKGAPGIYSADIGEDGALGSVRALANVENPTYLALSDKHKVVYAVSEVGSNTRIHSYTISADGGLAEQSSIQVPGGGLCHISLSGDQTVLYGACYSSGDVYSVSLAPTGALERVVSSFQHNDYDDISTAQSHAHCVLESPDGKYVVVSDLGLDALIVYTVNAGKMERIGYLSLDKGEGPRHLIFNPRDKSLLYCITEYSNVLYTLQMGEDGTLSVLDKVSNLPEDGPASSGAAVKISPDATRLAASNRHKSGEGSIALYSIADDGIPKDKRILTSGGEHPRDFCFSPDGGSLIVADQFSNNLAVVDIASGEVEKIEVSQPSYVYYSN